MCKYMTKTLSEALHVSYLPLSMGNDCILLDEMSNIVQQWEVKSVQGAHNPFQKREEGLIEPCQKLIPANKKLEMLWHEVKQVHKEHDNLWQGWTSTLYEILESGNDRGLKKGVYMMAMKLVNPPNVSPSKKGVPELVTTQVLPEEYKKTLKAYFDIGEMFKKLAVVFNVEEKTHPLKETLSQSKYSFEPVHGDRKHGFNFHQAHNTALFLNIVSLVVRCLRDGVEEPDLIQFRKDVRSLTARLDFKAKDRINNKKAHPRGNYKKKELKDVVKKAVSQLLSKSKTGKH